MRTSLSVRLALAMIVSLLAVQLQAFAQIRLLSKPELRLTGVRHLSLATNRAVRDALRLPKGSRQAYFADRTTDSHLKIWWSEEPSVDDAVEAAVPLKRLFVATLEHWLGDAARAVRVSNARLRYIFVMKNADIVVVPEQLENELSTAAIKDGEPEVLVATGARIAAQLHDGSWVNVEHASFVDSSSGSTLPMSPLFAGWLIIAVISICLARRLVTPLNRLIDAANRVGTVRGPVSMEKSSLHEFAAVAHAFEDMQQRLLNFVQGRTEMLAAISHDLRSALTRLQLIAEQHPSDHQKAALTTEIQDMAAILDSTMAFASGEARAAPNQPTDVAATLISIVDEVTDAGYDCIYEGPNHNETLANPVSLKRAFRNVIDNAIKYGSCARVRLSESPDRLLIEVSDSGPGLPKESFDAAFAPFERLDAARSNKVTGVGLGLTIARDVITSHGGSISLKNREGGGLVVSIRLPRSRQ